jgi:hypothetical protein
MLSASFLLVYTPSKRNKDCRHLAISPHCDQSLRKGVHTLSVVFTVKSSDCMGGTVQYSNRNDGKQRESKHLNNFNPKENSMYFMNGSYVAHCAYGVGSGVRYSVVLFYDTPQSMIDVVSLWNPRFPKEYICTNCYRPLRDRKQYIAHLGGMCPRCLTCCNLKMNLSTHVCSEMKL